MDAEVQPDETGALNPEAPSTNGVSIQLPPVETSSAQESAPDGTLASASSSSEGQEAQPGLTNGDTTQLSPPDAVPQEQPRVDQQQQLQPQQAQPSGFEEPPLKRARPSSDLIRVYDTWTKESFSDIPMETISSTRGSRSYRVMTKPDGTEEPQFRLHCSAWRCQGSCPYGVECTFIHAEIFKGVGGGAQSRRDYSQPGEYCSKNELCPLLMSALKDGKVDDCECRLYVIEDIETSWYVGAVVYGARICGGVGNHATTVEWAKAKVHSVLFGIEAEGIQSIFFAANMVAFRKI